MNALIQANRFHVHVHVTDLDHSIGFYTQLFGVEPTVTKHDYAKWLLDDPRVNFAISTGKSDGVGIAHLGLQAGTAEALAAIGARLQTSDAGALAQTGTTCCYARSDKFWTEDPQGIRWETFHTHGEAASDSAPDADATGSPCCGPETPQGACCPPKSDLAVDAPCCGATVP